LPWQNPYVQKKNDAAFGQRAFQFLEHLVAAFQRAGVRLMVGTDSINPLIVPGFSTIDEIRCLVKAGLTPYQALRAATRNAAEYLHQEREFGGVAVGQRADLLLLTADPFAHVDNLSRRVGVMLRGQWFTEEDLRRHLAAISAAYGTDVKSKSLGQRL
jgi:imidazolonepropionase-like amidohydrolase